MAQPTRPSTRPGDLVQVKVRGVTMAKWVYLIWLVPCRAAASCAGLGWWPIQPRSVGRIWFGDVDPPNP